MIDFIVHHRDGLVFIAIVLILLSTIAAQIPAPDHPSMLAWGVYAVVSPLQKVIAYAIVGARELWGEYVDLRSVRMENKALRDELTNLYRENQQLHETLALVGGEVELRAFQELYKEAYNYRALDALIIGAGTDAASHTVILNKGSVDGVKTDQGIICPSGVVGKVIRVGPASCLVQLITDPSFAMAARLQKSRVRGIIRGTGNEKKCDLLYIRETDAIEVNDRIVSSGVERIFPRGILIGRVSGIEPGEPPLRRVEAIPSVDLRSLEWVLIVQWRQENNEED